MRVLSALCILYFIAATIPAQVAREEPTAKLSPIPPLPVGGFIPDAMSKNHLFIDTSNSELVIIYLENGNTVTNRVPLASQVDPVFHLSITTYGQERQTYSYSVRNSAGARQRIAWWSFPLPFDTLLKQGDKEPDSGRRGISVVGKPQSWSVAEAVDAVGVHYLKCSTTSPNQGVAAGQEMTGFSLRSELKPGFFEAHVAGDSGVPALASLQVPSAIKAELKRLDSFHLNEQIVLILAPKFSSSVSPLAIAGDYYSGIRLLVTNGHLDAMSPFVVDAMNALKTYLDGAAIQADGPADEYPAPTLKDLHAPGNDMEKQIYEAMRIALDPFMK